MTKQILVGGVPVGGGAPVSIQSMLQYLYARCGRPPSRQIDRLAAAGCEIVRVAVPDMAAAKAVGEIKERHLHCRWWWIFTLTTVLRWRPLPPARIRSASTPATSAGRTGCKAVANACAKRGIPIRIGVNGGSLWKSLCWRSTAVRRPEALVESAFGHIALLE